MLRLTWVGPRVDLVTLTDPGRTTAVYSTVTVGGTIDPALRYVV